MAEAKAGLDISRKALLQSDSSALQCAAVEDILGTDELALQAHRWIKDVACLHAGLAAALVHNGGRIIESGVRADKVSLGLQSVAIVLQFEAIPHSGPGNLVVGSGKLSDE